MTSSQVFASVILLLATVRPGAAQTRIEPPRLRPNEQPTTSPYLLLGPNSTIFQRELNFFNQRRNERRLNAVNRELRVETRQLGNSIDELQKQPAGLPTRPLMESDTGHSTTFFNTFQYYPTRRSR